MIRFALNDLVEPLRARCVGPSVTFSGVTTDSRNVPEGALFVALEGERFDGHGFAQQALDQGAAAAMVARPEGLSGPCLVVADTLRALGELATLWRRCSTARVAAVTGSNGKTTVKEMLTSILALRAPTLFTQGNLNNEIGVPLTLFRLNDAHALAVIEMGANHAGEIARLTAMVEPDVGVVTNAGPSHLEGFGSLDGVARAKGELFRDLPAGAVAVINADDHYAPLWRELAGERRVVTFGLEGDADVTAARHGGTITMTVGGRCLDLALPVPGRHNLANAMAAAAAAHALGIAPEAIRDGLQGFRPAAGRLTRRAGRAGSELLDDTYNANPASLAAGLDVLAEADAPRWLILGDMGELGPDAEQLHAEAGRQALAAGVTRLLAVGPLSAAAVEAFGTGAEHFRDRDALVASARQALTGGVTVLIKGSRSMGMEAVVRALEEPETADGDG
ncbi:UDP-N-acetylmuramoyl-tripeptide--D-alanyl-D-alanine ligase [Aquisalimonas asiatica]|uniref:UDP-N-acetylmuramoyl-tripeptide--D-alanyl-D-alanine ligase n=1 Tax=Aquisalimonas asiatica TaxID=406100 RepID=A0A1H8S8K5_9GAMM|nr:UDP-N-acetylmuramoyl-tripeptide--D-alanyl-D-alanine ligase [Aquisalimonas asiatica]SEO74714.1 UDP-N-acetylmuramoyl-tripeptide--D-alanyl-D-alanine ligase [Aquisalimonas asiatica]